ncbi:MAG: hypothetical protein AAGG79_04860 [Pseudomonadota bacterium]
MKTSFFNSTAGLALLALLALMHLGFALTQLSQGQMLAALFAGTAALAWVGLLAFKLMRRR